MNLNDLLRRIPIVEVDGAVGQRRCAAKRAYSSAANAQRGAIACAWSRGFPSPGPAAVYQCPSCQDWHVGPLPQRSSPRLQTA